MSLGGSGGPTVNSNAQIGKENRQAVMSVEQTKKSLQVETLYRLR